MVAKERGTWGRNEHLGPGGWVGMLLLVMVPAYAYLILV